MDILDKRVNFYETLGITDDVWSYSDCKEAIAYFRIKGILILGGDLITKNKKGDFEIELINWYYNGKNLLESYAKAENFLLEIKSYVQSKEAYIAFVTR